MTPDEVRAIVREEIAAIQDAQSFDASIELTLDYANMRHQAEQMFEEMHIPEAEREILLRYFEAMKP